MPLPRVRMDFNGTSLENCWTLEDIKRQGIEFYDGMRCVFYDFDAEHGKTGYLHSDGTVWWDAESKQFRIDMQTIQFRFTAGNDLTVLDALYME